MAPFSLAAPPIMEPLIELYEMARRPGAFLALFTALFVFGKELDRWIGGYDTDRQIGLEGNQAVALSTAGYYLSIIIVFVGAIQGGSGQEGSGRLSTELALTGGYTLGGTVLLLMQRKITETLILPGISLSRHLTEDRNRAVGVVLLGSYIASALIVAGCTYGKQADPGVVLGFYVLGQMGLVAFTLLYEWATPFWLPSHIEEGNLAVGIGLASTLLAIGLLMMRAALAEFPGWTSSLSRVGENLLIVLVHLAGLRLFFHVEFLPVEELYLGITRDENVAAGLMQFVVSVGFAAVLIAVL